LNSRHITNDNESGHALLFYLIAKEEEEENSAWAARLDDKEQLVK